MMRERGDTTRFGFPPAPEPWVKLPATVPWDTPISELSGYWIEVTCKCGRSSHLPLRRLAADLGWSQTLRLVLPKLRCNGRASGAPCGQTPARVVMVVDTYPGGRDKVRPELQLVP